jgi:ABC-type transport system involved in multi-copper enzyme maturation permease subunit
MSRLLSVEWIKLRHRWMPWILVALILCLEALTVLIVAFNADRDNFEGVRGLVYGLSTAGYIATIILPVLAGLWGGQEYSSGTIQLTLMRRPSRWKPPIAGMTIMLFVTLVVLLATLIVFAAGGAIIHGLNPCPNVGCSKLDPISSHPWVAMVELFFGEALCVGFYVVLGYAVGVIFRSTAAGIGVALGGWIGQYIVKGIFTHLGATTAAIADKFPLNFINGLTTHLAHRAVTNIGLRGPGIGTSLVWVVIYYAVTIGIALFVVQRRDVTG